MRKETFPNCVDILLTLRPEKIETNSYLMSHKKLFRSAELGQMVFSIATIP